MSAPRANICAMREVFIGSEELASGRLTRAKLRWNYRRMFPDVYATSALPSLRERTLGAWLWSRRDGIIAGRAAAALHGAKWVDRGAPIEMIWKCGRPPSGLVVRSERIDGDEITQIDGLFVTTPERTALDLARHLPRNSAVVHLDALAQASGVSAMDVLTLAHRYPGSRGIRSAVTALSLMDDGAESPHETLLRLVLRDKWLDVPTTQIRAGDGDVDAVIDVGYEEPRVGLDYEGKHFDETDGVAEFTERAESLKGLGWHYRHVVCEDSVGSILEMVRQSFVRSGYRPTVNPSRR